MEILMIDGSAENSIVSMWSEVKISEKNQEFVYALSIQL